MSIRRKSLKCLGLYPPVSHTSPLLPRTSSQLSHGDSISKKFGQHVPSPQFNSEKWSVPKDIQERTLSLLKWWNQNPDKPLGLSCRADQPRRVDFPKEVNGILEGFFEARAPIVGSDRVQVAMVVPFADFQLRKVRAAVEHWKTVTPCVPETDLGYSEMVGIVFASMGSTSVAAKVETRRYFESLGPLKRCFNGAQLHFLEVETSEDEKDYGHFDGAAFMFFKLFEVLEKKYKTFVIIEPDVMPVQDGWVPGMVKASLAMDCEDGFWQLGSPPMGNPNFGDLHKRVDFHMNGNGMYLLGCPAYEDYKCRMQTYYRPLGPCERVSGCNTMEMYEDGYDHALYRFRYQPENFVYARSVLHRFAYTPLVQNLGEDDYEREDIVRFSPMTYFVHSKVRHLHYIRYRRHCHSRPSTLRNSYLTRDLVHRFIVAQSVFWSNAEIVLRKAFGGILGASPDIDKTLALRLYTGVRTGEMTLDDVKRDLCLSDIYTSKVSGNQIDPSPACQGLQSESRENWADKFPGRVYLWTADFHGGPINCDIPIITEAGGVVHAEIDFGNCEYFGLCKDRLKVLSFDNWRGFDPDEQVKEKFKEAYQNDDEFARVDAFVCSHPAANCELFIPFNKVSDGSFHPQ